MAALEQRRKLLTASAAACDNRITVTVNADGVLIETKFSGDVVDLSYAEVAEALPLAVRAAAREVTRKSRAMMWPLLDRDTETPVTAGDAGAPGAGSSVPLTPTSHDLPASLRDSGKPGHDD
ncbi:YbaB/EbfC family nucleoid-associated protein [Nocardia sp. BMG51109]|uniref:YbaB/EbfC family nucleoid-associated protein n=1 Tax=Nocardia sp. BMG51109 TaxID=1056816 RepID=UPI001E551D55|nr:YbaB/EbfC family nucleoid-associated protein [Nocardia sp. BMG51109]